MELNIFKFILLSISLILLILNFILTYKVKNKNIIPKNGITPVRIISVIFFIIIFSYLFFSNRILMALLLSNIIFFIDKLIILKNN